VLLVRCGLSHGDDGPAGLPRYHPACRPGGRPLVERLWRAAPVRFYSGLDARFFRRLPGDGRIGACASRV